MTWSSFVFNLGIYAHTHARPRQENKFKKETKDKTNAIKHKNTNNFTLETQTIFLLLLGVWTQSGDEPNWARDLASWRVLLHIAELGWMPPDATHAAPGDSFFHQASAEDTRERHKRAWRLVQTARHGKKRQTMSLGQVFREVVKEFLQMWPIHTWVKASRAPLEFRKICKS